MTKPVTVFLLVITLAVAWPTDAAACSCLPTTADKAMVRSDVVFTGRVLSIVPGRNVNTGQRVYTGPDGRAVVSDEELIRQYTVTFELTRQWKGLEQNTIVLEYTLGTGKTGRGWNVVNSCAGFTVAVGREYLVFARSNKDGKLAFDTSTCSKTASIDRAERSMQELGNPRIP